MKVSLIKITSAIDESKNPELLRFLLYLYGTVNPEVPFTNQRVRMDRSKKLLNEVFILPIVPQNNSSSLMERYDHLKKYKWDLSKMKSFFDGLNHSGILKPSHYTRAVPYEGSPQVTFKFYGRDVTRIIQALNEYLNDTSN